MSRYIAGEALCGLITAYFAWQEIKVWEGTPKASQRILIVKTLVDPSRPNQKPRVFAFRRRSLIEAPRRRRCCVHWTPLAAVR